MPFKEFEDPFLRYTNAPEGEYIIDYAEYLAHKACLAEDGFEFAGEPPSRQDSVAIVVLGDGVLDPDLGLLSLEAASTDKRVLKAFEAWRDCMEERGHQYAHPCDLTCNTNWTRPPGQREIDTAAADVRHAQRIIAEFE